MSALTVNLGENSYDILIDTGSLSSLGMHCKNIGLNGSAAVITNPTVSSFYGETALRSLTEAGNSAVMIEIPDGEEFKNPETLSRIYDALIEGGIDRNSFIVALGGGVVGDLAGFAAATYLRGIAFVQVPTTLLAQVDSSVGGKTAIDHPRGKNLIGAFYQPRLVLIDLETLATLPEREFRAGMAEVVKYGIVLDHQFFEFLEKNAEKIIGMERESLAHLIQRCCQLKAQVVELDEKESGLRAVLNYGHTLGHALETMAGYRELAHGEAVAIGMVLAARISLSLGRCAATECARIENLLTRFGLSISPPPVERERLLDALAKDKKSHGKIISFICNQGIGNYKVEKLPPEQLLSLSGLGGRAGVGSSGIRNAFAVFRADLPVPDGMDAEFQEFEDKAGEELAVDWDGDEVIEDIEILDIDEADLLDDDEAFDVGPGVPKTPNSAFSDPLFTPTLAELYVKQGFIDKALGIYRTLIAADPSNVVVIERIKALEAMESDAEDSAGLDVEMPCQQADSFSQAPPTSSSGIAARDEDDRAVAELEGWLGNIGKIKEFA